jgi:flagellar assembly protein FliH
MDGGDSAAFGAPAFEPSQGFRAGPGPAQARFVSQPGLTAPDGPVGFEKRAPLALVTVPRAPEPSPPPVIAEPAPPEPVTPPPVQQAVMPRPLPPAPAQLAETRAVALAEGRALGLADAEAMLRTERDGLRAQASALAAALAHLAEPPVAEVDALTQSIARAVSRLASERAGQAIDIMPAPFAHRIARLAERVAQGIRDVSVHLHPDDLAAIQPLLSEACAPDLSTLAAARLVPDASLSRGDADLRAPGLRLADLSGAAEIALIESPTQ